MSVEASMKNLSLKQYECQGFEESKYKKYSIRELNDSMEGEHVTFFGWVTWDSATKNYTFIELSAEFSTVKIVIPGSYDITMTTSIRVYGTIKKCSSEKDSFTFEVHVDKFEVYNNKHAPSFPIQEDSDKKIRLDKGHLALRTPKRTLFLKARSNLLYAMRDFYNTTHHTEITPPTMVQTQVEGGSTLFTLQYFDEPAYLTQSSQLYLETVIPVAGKAYCIMPSYRAEKSKTSRLLTEYTHVEAELADIVFEDLLNSIESVVKHSISKFYEITLSDILKYEPDFKKFEVASGPFKRITYDDAIEFLKKHDHMKADGTPYEYMDDIADFSEKFLVEKYANNQPLFMTHFPAALKSFYMKRVGDLTESVDLLFPGIGEIVGGSMRLDEADKLEEAFKNAGISPEPYYWYIDMCRFGPCSHGGYGLGFERLLMRLMHYDHVDDATLYPRKVNRCKP